MSNIAPKTRKNYQVQKLKPVATNLHQEKRICPRNGARRGEKDVIPVAANGEFRLLGFPWWCWIPELARFQIASRTCRFNKGLIHERGGTNDFSRA